MDHIEIWHSDRNSAPFALIPASARVKKLGDEGDAGRERARARGREGGRENERERERLLLRNYYNIVAMCVRVKRQGREAGRENRGKRKQGAGGSN
jgi:hypothetical protein